MISAPSPLLKVLLFATLLSCTSCARYYIPTTRNVPLLEKRGDFQVNASLGTGVNAQFAYSPIKYVGISGSALYANDEWWRYRNFHQHHALEGALGFYLPKGKLIIELFAGYGQGGGEAQEKHEESLFADAWLKKFQGDYQKYFIQPTVGWKIRPRMLVAFTARVSKLQSSNFHFHSEGVYPIPHVKSDGLFFEPSGTFKIYPLRRSQIFFAYGQIGASRSLFRAEESFYNFLQLNAGAGIRLGRK